MRGAFFAIATLPALLAAAPSTAEPLLWAFQAEQAEYRLGEGGADAFAWDVDAYIGTDELKARWISKGEYAFDEDVFEELENQLRLQTPVSDFWDVVAGVRIDTPEGPDRVYGVIGLHGLAPQWIEVDADLYISEDPRLGLDLEYEALITNRLILTPSVDVDLPLTDDPAIGLSGFGPTIEVGARLSYDLVDRALSPYIGAHYERAFGETAGPVRADGGDPEAIYLVAGVKMLF